MSLASTSIRRPVAVFMLFLAIGLLGVISYFRLPIDLLPDIAYPRLVVYTTYPDVGPTEVERFVTEPIERQVVAVPGIVRVESVSREGVSLVTMRFAWGTDMDFAVLNVREKLDNVREQLPELSDRPVVLRTDPTSEPVMAVSVSGRDDLWGLKDLAEQVFKRRLEQVDGVAQAGVVGGLEREIQVEVDPRLLDSYGLGIGQIIQALDAANMSAPGGTIRRGRYRYALRTLGEFQSVDQIARVPLTAEGADSTSISGIVRLADVATITDGFKDRESIARYNGRDAVGLLIFKESGANTVRVAEQVEQVLDQLREQYPDLALDVPMSQAGFIRDAISSVVQALLYGGALAFLVLFLFLRDARYPVAISIAIPISVIWAFSLLDFAGVSLNIMSLGGLALGVGMLVDNSIVVLENVFRHRALGKSPAEAAAVGADEVQGAIAASTLTTVSVFIPIIYVEGVAGQLFSSLSLAVTFSLLASLAVALTALPAIAARFGTARQDEGGELIQRMRERIPAAKGRVRQLRARVSAATLVAAHGAVSGARRVFRTVGRGTGRATRPGLDAFDRRFERFAAWYHTLLARSLAHRGRVVAAALGTFVLGMVLMATFDRDVLPEVDQGSFQARIALDRGSPLERTADAVTRLERQLLANEEVDAVFTRIGRQQALAGVEDEESGLNTATVDVRLVDGAGTARTLEDLAPVFESFPPGVLTVETGRSTALGRLLGGAEADLAVRIRGDDLDAAYRYARETAARLSGTPALGNVRLSSAEGQPEVLVEIDRERAAAFGVEPRAVAQTVERFMRGEAATDFKDFDRNIPIVVRLPDEERRSLSSLELLTVSGVPVRELVDTRETVGPAEIRRVEQSRTVAVYADVASGTLDEALAEVSEVLAANPAPRDLRVDVGGENEERARSFRDLALAFGLALILIYMIMAAQFESFVHPFTILLSVPLAVVGVAVALLLFGMGLNTMSLIGMVILVGIVVNNAIVKVDCINQLRAHGMERRAAILEAGRVRLRPILMTTITTVLGLAPMAAGLGSGSALRAPLAVVIIGGLISATALTLIVVPVAYDLIEDLQTRVRSLGFGEAPAAGAGADPAGPARGEA